MTAELGRRVRDRARHCCEYCQLPQRLISFPFPIDHIIARQHGGETVAANLALACVRCNLHKGPNVAGVDPKTRRIVRLYQPRRDRWGKHFAWDGPRLLGLTANGRATIVVLAINDPSIVDLRSQLIEEGVFPPAELLS